MLGNLAIVGTGPEMFFGNTVLTKVSIIAQLWTSVQICAIVVVEYLCLCVDEHLAGVISNFLI